MKQEHEGYIILEPQPCTEGEDTYMEPMLCAEPVQHYTIDRYETNDFGSTRAYGHWEPPLISIMEELYRLNGKKVKITIEVEEE